MRSRMFIPLVACACVSMLACAQSEPDTGGATTEEAAPDPAAKAEAVAKEIEGGATNAAWHFGAPVTEMATPIVSVKEDPASFTGKTVAVSGVVSSVCQAQGCWVEVAADDGTKMMAYSEDHQVLLPKNCAGQRITVQGTVSVDEDGPSLTMDAVDLRSPAAG